MTITNGSNHSIFARITLTLYTFTVYIFPLDSVTETSSNMCTVKGVWPWWRSRFQWEVANTVGILWNFIQHTAPRGTGRHFDSRIIPRENKCRNWYHHHSKEDNPSFLLVVESLKTTKPVWRCGPIEFAMICAWWHLNWVPLVISNRIWWPAKWVSSVGSKVGSMLFRCRFEVDSNGGIHYGYEISIVGGCGCSLSVYFVYRNTF